MDSVIAIIGPTAVGKTKISIDLAKRFDTEIISGDSMLLYRGMNIGTAKPTIAEQSGIIHHMIDILEPTEEFSVVDFQETAAKYISDINMQGKTPILAGGTGLYVKALLEGYKFNSTSGCCEKRSEMEALASKFGNQYLHNMLAEVDPQNAARLHPNDIRRVIRALEVFHLSGNALNQSKLLSDTNKLVYKAIVVGLTMNRRALYDRINLRVDKMIEDGLVEEVAELMRRGVPEQAQAMQGIGYKEIVAYLKGDINLSDAIDQIKQATRRFAKRQLTWYRKMDYTVWFDVDDFSDYDIMLETFYRHIAGKLCVK